MLVNRQSPKMMWLRAIVLAIALIGVFWAMSSLKKNPQVLVPVSEGVFETTTTTLVDHDRAG